MVIPTVAFGIGGIYLDRSTGMSPLFTLLGFALALVVAGFGVYRAVKKILQTEATEEAAKKSVSAS